MENYYEKLNLDSSSSASEINKALSQLESTWKRREINNPEKATTMLALILEARKVFSTDASQRLYDQELATSKEKPITPDPNAERKKQFEKWRSDALSYFDSRQYDLAKTATDQALSYYDTSTDNDAFYSLVADVYRMNRIYPTALDYINKAIVINPQNATYYIIKAGIYHDQAYSDQGYKSYGEDEELIQNAWGYLNQAVNIAHRNSDRVSESVAYGLLAFYHYFGRFGYPDLAEEYANKSVDLGDVGGNASKVLEDIRKKRQQEAKSAKEEQERKERQAAAERERQRKESRDETLRALYNICGIAFFGWLAFTLYRMFKLWDLYAFNFEFSIAVFLIIIAAWSFFQEVSGVVGGAGKSVSRIFFGGYLFGVTGVKYEQWGVTARAWEFLGMHILILIAVIIVFSLIGKAVRKSMK